MDRFESFFQIRSFEIEQNQFCFNHNDAKNAIYSSKHCNYTGDVKHNKLSALYSKKRINRNSLKYLEKGLSDYRKGRSSIEAVFSL